MEDDNYIPLSYISQYNYCRRRAGLLMLEQQWSDSADTVKGSLEHKNVHTASITSRNSMIVAGNAKCKKTTRKTQKISKK